MADRSKDDNKKLTKVRIYKAIDRRLRAISKNVQTLHTSQEK